MENSVQSLFEPLQIGPLTSRNRILMPPMNSNMAYGDGFASPKNRDYYAERAKGGAGVIILEAIFIEWAAKHRTFGMGVSEDKYIPGLRMVAEGIQEHGALAVAQINHNGRLLTEDVTGLQTVAVSTVANPATGEVSVELDGEEIQEMVEKYGQAARRIKEAGFDAVEIHGAHGYLLAQFISPFTNKRADLYGGSLENRMRVPLMVVKRVKELCGADYPVFYRLSANEYFQGGLTLEDSTIFAQELEKAGVDLLDVSGSSLEGPHKLAKVIPCSYHPHGYHMASAAALKKVLNIPVAGVGRINSPQIAARFLDEGQADMVAVGRQFIIDPHWPNKAREGRFEDIRRCIACNTCLDVLLANRGPITCVLNPDVTQEATAALEPAAQPHKVVVVGAGPAGLEAACLAAQRGHKVIVLEKSGVIGGQLRLACLAPGKEEIETIIDYYEARIRKLGIELKLGTEATPTVLDAWDPDHVVLATGAHSSEPEGDWAAGCDAATAWEVFQGSVEPGHKVVVVGGGRTGLETADYLLQKGHEVIVLEVGARIGADLGLTVRPALMNRLMRSSVNIFNKAQITRVSGADVTFDRDGDVITLHAVDSIVTALGAVAFNPLQPDLAGKSYPVHVIGDAVKVGGIMEAVAGGARIGRQV